jgi:pSer/pThr/pTyr-binding forkhead associated (FHA) protein/predicted Ser/Thr protein kinase
MAGEQLRVSEGKKHGKVMRVDADLLLGRQAPNEEGKLGGDPRISRRHARVWRGEDGRLSVEDLGSANGTFVNDERIGAARVLEPGDLVRVGSTVLEVTGGPRQVAERPSAEAAAALTISGEGRRLSVTDELVIGRGVSGEGRLSEDLELSRRHARVWREADGRIMVEDLGSANGTFVNGERVPGPRQLYAGDKVRVGTTLLEVTDVGAAPAARPATPAPPPATPVPPAPPSARPPAPPVADRPARTPPAAPPPRPRPRPAPAERGAVATELPLDSVFAGCRVEEVIGRGDMGVVYRAEELALQRTVALKLIVSEYSREERFRERFRRESRIAAAIDHPNVIPVFDAGEEQGALYIMMRLVEGTDLRAVIDQEGGLDPRRAARIVRQVGAALDAAHARGMLHRDVKPSNVLLARRDHAYLSDFGLAKPADSLEALTRHGTIVARAEYVAPEQVLGQRVDARADIYALGCLLFEALTGEAPFERSAPGVGAAALAHVDAPRPSPLDIRPDLPREFDDVVKRAMAKDPDERYPSAGDLGQAALVAAGGLRRANPWSVVATGEAAPLAARVGARERARAPAGRAETPAGREGAPGEAPAEAATAGARAGGSDASRWAIALAGLVIIAIGMVAALHGISTL